MTEWERAFFLIGILATFSIAIGLLITGVGLLIDYAINRWMTGRNRFRK